MQRPREPAFGEGTLNRQAYKLMSWETRKPQMRPCSPQQIKRGMQQSESSEWSAKAGKVRTGSADVQGGTNLQWPKSRKASGPEQRKHSRRAALGAGEDIWLHRSRKENRHFPLQWGSRSLRLFSSWYNNVFSVYGLIIVREFSQ